MNIRRVAFGLALALAGLTVPLAILRPGLIPPADAPPAAAVEIRVTNRPPTQTAAARIAKTGPPTLALPAQPASGPLTPAALSEDPAALDSDEILIPAIDLHAAVKVVPLRDGVWNVDHLGQSAGRLEGLGRWPGDARAVVLTGHVSLRTGQAGAFGHLSELNQGDQVLYRTQGQDYVYTVTGRQYIEPDEVKAMYDASGHQLLLLTCAGFEPLNWTYTQRLLVTADLLSPPAR